MDNERNHFDTAFAVLFRRRLDDERERRTFRKSISSLPASPLRSSAPSPNRFEPATVSCAFPLPSLFAHASVVRPSVRSPVCNIFISRRDGSANGLPFSTAAAPPPPAPSLATLNIPLLSLRLPLRNATPTHSKRILNFERTVRPPGHSRYGLPPVHILHAASDQQLIWRERETEREGEMPVEQE